MSETDQSPTIGCHYPDTFAGRLRALADAWRNRVPDNGVIAEGPDYGAPYLLWSDLDAALTEIVQLDRKLDNERFEAGTAVRELRTELARVRTELDARIAAESADAAAGSYAGRAEEAEARAKRAEAICREWRVENGLLRDRAIAAETELAVLRSSLARPEIQHRIVGVGGHVHTPTERDLASKAQWLPNVRHEVRDVYPGEWRDADEAATPRTVLERAADEQGVPLVCDVDKLTAPEHERLSDEEWTAYAGALGIETGDEQDSTRDQIERFLTDDGRRKVAEYLAEAAGDNDIDIDAVIAQNHADAHREYFGDEQGDGEG